MICVTHKNSRNFQFHDWKKCHKTEKKKSWDNESRHFSEKTFNKFKDLNFISGYDWVFMKPKE